MQSTLNDPPENPWPHLAPLLDSAVEALNETNRRAIVLRFYEGHNLREIGAALGSSEDAAKIRVSRALEKLRSYFARRGVVVPSAVLAGVISANSTQAAPALLAKTTAAAVISSTLISPSILTLSKGALKIMAWTKAKTAIIASVSLLLAAGITTVSLHEYNASRPIIGIPENWSVLAGDASQWKWADGKINAQSTNGDTILASAQNYRDVSISTILSTTSRDADIALRLQDAQNGYFILFVPDGTPWAADNGSHISLIKRKDGQEESLASFKRKGLPQSAKISVSAKGPAIEVRLNDAVILNVIDNTFKSGYIGLRVCGDSIKPSDATFAQLTIR
jgi:hypothetical protein